MRGCSLADHQDRPPGSANLRTSFRDGALHRLVSECERLMLSRSWWNEKSRNKLLSYFGKKTMIKGFKCYGYPWLVFIGKVPEIVWKDRHVKIVGGVAETDQLPFSVLRAWANRGWVTIEERMSSSSPKHGHESAKYVIRLTDEARQEIKKMKA